MRVFLGETIIWIRRPLLRNVGYHLSILFSRRILSSSLLSSSVFPLSHYRSWDFRLFLSLRVRKSELLVLQPSTLGFTPVSPSFLRPLHADWIRVNFSGSPAGKWQIMGLLSLHNHGESILTLNLLLICLSTYTLLALFLGIMINTEAKEKDLVCFERWGRLMMGFLGCGFFPAWSFVPQGSSTHYPLRSLALKQCIWLSPTSCFWIGDIFLKFWLRWGLGTLWTF